MKVKIYASDNGIVLKKEFEFANLYRFIDYIEAYNPDKECQKNPEYLTTHEATKDKGFVGNINGFIKSKVKEYLAELSQSDEFIEAIKAKIMPIYDPDKTKDCKDSFVIEGVPVEVKYKAQGCHDVEEFYQDDDQKQEEAEKKIKSAISVNDDGKLEISDEFAEAIRAKLQLGQIVNDLIDLINADKTEIEALKAKIMPKVDVPEKLLLDRIKELVAFYEKHEHFNFNDLLNDIQKIVKE